MSPSEKAACGMPDRPDGPLPMNAVVRSEEGAVGLRVDRIGDVIETDTDQLEVSPDTVSPQARDLIRGAFELDSQLLLALDGPCAVEL